MRMGAPVAICPPLRREGGFNLHHCCTQMLKHMADDRIILDQKAITLDLAGGMTIADMPCELDQITSDFQQWLKSCNNFNSLSIGQCKSVTMIQRCRLRQIHQKTCAFGCFKNLAAQESVLIKQQAAVTGMRPSARF